MPPETQLLLRNETRVFARHVSWLIVDPPDSNTAAVLRRHNATFWTRHYAIARAMPADTQAHFGTTPPPSSSGRYGGAVVFLPKGRRFQGMTFAQVRRQVDVGGPVYVVGANQAGIKSIPKHLAASMGAVRTVDAARRCTLVEATVSEPTRPDAPLPPSSDAPSVDGDWSQRWTASVEGWTIEVSTIPGTFSEDRLDAGTAELLAALANDSLGARILDLCCGSGVVGAMLAKRRPDAEVMLVDAHASAITSTAATIILNRLTNAQSGPSDWYSDVRGQFDTIVCNPPFHEGTATNTTMVDAVISGARTHLAPEGALWLVANRFLPYANPLTAEFSRVDVVRENTRYRVYRCRRPRAARGPGRNKGKARRR